MGAIDPNNFLHSLATFMATGASLAYGSGSVRALWRNQVVEKAGGITAADPASWLVIYGGPASNWDPQARRTIQCGTVGTGQDLTLRQAQRLFETLLDAEGHPLRMKVITGLNATSGAADGQWTLVSVDLLQAPGLVGVDERNRPRAIFNFEVGFFKNGA